MGPLGTTAVEAEADVRVGGRYHVRMVVPGDEHNVSGVYREVVPNEKLVFTWAWRSTPERESLVTVHLKPDGTGTLMTFTHEQFFDEKARDDHEKGWLGTFTKLGTYLGLTPSKEDPSISGPPHGKFVWNELNTQNLDGAKKFLSDTLGWTYEKMDTPKGTYWIIKNGEDPVAGLFDMSGETSCKGVPEHWLSYVAVDDVDKRYKDALTKGAKEGRAPFDIPGVGRIAILAQPGGAMVGWITPKPM
jgi:predicted enzyme related to lactoylglutathione lyase